MSKRSSVQDLERRLKEELAKAAKERGLDSARVRDALRVDQRGSNVEIKLGDVVAVSLPGPSQDAVDAWFTQYGAALLVALLALVGVALGYVIAKTR
jgi:hypothetical protein